MMQFPTKRRRQTATDPDEEDCNASPKKNSLDNFLRSPDRKPAIAKPFAPASSLPSRRRPTRAPTKSPISSPEKSRRKPTFDNERGRSADLKTMFSKQSQRKRPAAPVTATTTATAIDNATARLEELDDDPISDGDDVPYNKSSSTSTVGQTARKRLKTSKKQYIPSSAPPATTRSSRSRPSSTTTNSSVFLKPPPPPSSLRATQDEGQDGDGKGGKDGDDNRPWADRFAPTSLDELAVHQRKISDVRQWLEGVVNGRVPQRLLILKGAAGTGKTTAVRLLAKELECELLEWRNPTGSGLGFVSFSAQFEEFVTTGAKFSQLDLDSDSPDQPSVISANGQHDQTKLILIEEFPNTFVRSSPALLSFRKSVLAYLANNTPLLSGRSHQKLARPATPMVLVISETLLTTTSASADSFTAHRLLGPEILQHPGAALIEFNNIAPTILAKALELVVVKEAGKSGRRFTPGPQVLKKLGEVGDIRSAISSLQFLCIKGDCETDWGAKVPFSKPKRASKLALTRGERASLELVTQREATLGIFHAVGKVVYNKRDSKPSTPGMAEALVENIPLHLSHTARPNRSEVEVERLIDETGTDTGTFISALHENYALSCVPTGPEDMNSSLDYIGDCLEYLSSSDMVCPSWDVFFGGKGPSGGFNHSGSHVLRQDELGFQVAVRGLLYSLPSPVKRIRSSPVGRGPDAYRMFFPTSIKLWRSKEEMEGMLDMWASKLLDGGRGNSGAESKFKGIMDGAVAFRRTNKPQVGGRQAEEAGEGTGGEDGSTALLSLGSSARKEMVLERLPYMAHIARAGKGQFGTTIGLREMEKVVSFRAGLRLDDDDDDNDDSNEQDCATDPTEAWATDKPAEESVLSKGKKTNKIMMARGREAKVGVGTVATTAGQTQNHLFLSFDDIED